MRRSGDPDGLRPVRAVAPPPRPEPTARVGRLVAASVVLLALVAAACQPPSGPERVRGLVVAVEARSLARADTVRVRADDGRELTFRVDPGVNVTPGHLREHMTLGEPVIVEYTRGPDGLLAVRIDDG